MKKNILHLLIVIVSTFTFLEANSQNFPKLDVSPMDATSYPSNWRQSNKIVKIYYSRPQLKGRALEKLAPEGKVWRTGANEAPEITFYTDVMFGDKEVKAGTYSLFTIPNKENWTIILSNQKNIWGAYFYDKSKDEIRVTSKLSNSETTIEAFSIAFEGEGDKATMHMGWGKTISSIDIVKK